MTTGRPGLAPSARWLRDRLQGLGFSEDQFAVGSPPVAPQLSEADLEPSSYNLEFASLVQRVQRLLGGGRGVSIYVTGPRGDLLARHHLAAQLAVGLGPLGRQVVIVDADVLRPGLSGLLADPYAEGLVDMVRFGRSTRSLLQHPVASGPWILPSGSFPADDPAPLAADALRSVVFRISQVCDLALYVGPLPIRNDIHPLARVCDHVLCAGSEHAEPEASARLVDQLTELQRNGAHVLGVVWYMLPETRLNPYETAIAALAVPPAPDPFALPDPLPRDIAARVPDGGLAGGEPRFEPGFLYAPDESAMPPVTPVESQPDWLLGSEPPLDFPAFQPHEPVPDVASAPASPFEFELGGESEREPGAAWAPPAAPPLPDWQAGFAPPPASPAAPEFPSFAPLAAEPALGAADESRFAPREAAEVQAREAFAGPGDAIFLRGGAGAEPEPADTMRHARDESPDAPRSIEAPSADYAFESESNESRWIPIVVVAMVALILGFVGWALWARHHANDQLVAPAPRPVPVAAPQDAAAHGDAPQTGESGASGTPPATGSAVPNDGAASHAESPKVTPPVPTATKPPVEAKAIKPPVDAPATTGPKTGSIPAPLPSAAVKVPAATDAPAAPVVPKPPRAAPETAAANAAAGVPFAVHVASYKTLGQASKEIAQLQKFGYKANAIETDLGSKGMWYRVYVGSYPTVAEAEAARDAILKLPGYNFAQVHRLPR